MRVVETVPDWFAVVQGPVLAGRTLAPNDLLMRANVCVLTEHGVRRLLAAEHMVGQRIRISSGVFEVIGIVKNETGGTVRAPDSEADAYIPLTTGTKLFGEANIRYSAGGMEGEKVEHSQIHRAHGRYCRRGAASKAIEPYWRASTKKKDYRIDGR
jgi:putative ABC transport system permease protein